MRRASLLLALIVLLPVGCFPSAQGSPSVSAVGTSSPIPPGPSPTASPNPTASGSPCPPTPTTAAEVIQMGVATAASCYGQTSLTIQGYSLDCGGCGGVDEYDRSPSWLAVFIPLYFIGPVAGAPGLDPTMGLPLFVDPATSVSFPAVGMLVQATGHFNDAIAATCTVTPKPGSTATPTNPAAVIAACQQSFVVTAASAITP